MIEILSQSSESHIQSVSQSHIITIFFTVSQSVSQSLNYHYSAVCREIVSISLTVCTWLLMLYGHDFLILKCCWNLHCLFFVLCAMCEPLLKKPRTTVEPNQPDPDPEPGLVDLDKPMSNTGQTGPSSEDQVPRLCGISRSWPIRFKKHTQDELNRVIPPDHGYWREDAYLN